MGYVSISDHSGLFFCALKLNTTPLHVFCSMHISSGHSIKIQHKNSFTDLSQIQKPGYRVKEFDRSKKGEFVQVPASKPGYFYRYTEDVIIHAGHGFYSMHFSSRTASKFIHRPIPDSKTGLSWKRIRPV